MGLLRFVKIARVETNGYPCVPGLSGYFKITQFGIKAQAGGPAPSLEVRQVDVSIELSWPAAAQGFVLESTALLGCQATWKQVGPR
jgi:hypothetical protein